MVRSQATYEIYSADLMEVHTKLTLANFTLVVCFSNLPSEGFLELFFQYGWKASDRLCYILTTKSLFLWDNLVIFDPGLHLRNYDGDSWQSLNLAAVPYTKRILAEFKFDGGPPNITSLSCDTIRKQ